MPAESVPQGTPTTTVDVLASGGDLVTVRRELGMMPGPVGAEWVRNGMLQTSLARDAASQR